MSSRLKEVRRDAIRTSGHIAGKAKDKVNDITSRAKKVRRAGRRERFRRRRKRGTEVLKQLEMNSVRRLALERRKRTGLSE